MDLHKNMGMLQKSDVSLDIVNEALNHPYFVVQANALIGLGKKLRQYPEYRTNDWIEKLHTIICSPNAKIELIGGTNLIHFCLGCVAQIGTPEADAYFIEQFNKLDNFDADRLNYIRPLFDDPD